MIYTYKGKKRRKKRKKKKKKKKKKRKKISLLEQNFYACYELASRDNSTLTQLRGKENDFAIN